MYQSKRSVQNKNVYQTNTHKKYSCVSSGPLKERMLKAESKTKKKLMIKNTSKTLKQPHICIYETQSKQNGNSNKIRNKEFEILILYSWTQEREKNNKIWNETHNTYEKKEKKTSKNLLKSIYTNGFHCRYDAIQNTLFRFVYRCFLFLFPFYFLFEMVQRASHTYKWIVIDKILRKLPNMIYRRFLSMRKQQKKCNNKKILFRNKKI